MARLKSDQEPVWETVQDAETARQVFVARAVYYGTNYGYGGHINTALTEIGLGEYIPATGRTYAVKTDKLHALIGETINVPTGAARTPATSDRTNSAVEAIVSIWRGSLTSEDYSEVPPSPQAVNVSDLVGRFGERRTLPPVASDEVTEVWRDLVSKVLVWGDDNTTYGKLCSELENLLSLLGFGEYVPSGIKDITVRWQGWEVELKGIRHDRKGNPDPAYVRQSLADHVYRLELSDFEVVNAVPATAE